MPNVVTASRAIRAEARTATAAGTTTGQVSVGTDYVTVTCDDVNKIITLPDSPLGTRITLVNGATGYELRTTDPTTIGINGGTGAAAESAVAASTTVWVQRVTATNWNGWSRIANGTLAVVEVAAP